MYYFSGSPKVATRPAASASPGNLLQMLIFRSHPRPLNQKLRGWFWCWLSDWGVSRKPPSGSEMFLPLRLSKEKCCGIKVIKKTNKQEPAGGGNLEGDNTGLNKFILSQSYSMFIVKSIVLWYKFNTNEFIFLFSELFCLFSIICAENKPWNWKHVQQQKCFISHFIIDPKHIFIPFPISFGFLNNVANHRT